MNRRTIMKTLGLAGMTLSSQKLFSQTKFVENMPETVPSDVDAPIEKVRQTTIPIWQTTTTETATTLVAVGPNDDLLSFQITETNSSAPLKYQVQVFEPVKGEEKIYHLHFSNLQSGKMYQILATSNSGELKVTRQFKTLNSSARHFAVISCSNFLLVSHTLWKSVQDNKPDYILYLGDCIYADTATGALFKTPSKPELAFERYISTIMAVPLYHQEQLVPIYNIWDDHDYGWNNGDARHPYRNFMIKLFRIFFPLRAGFDLSIGPGVSFAETLGGIRLICTDDRSFRIYENQGNQLYGPEQRDWIVNELQRARGPVAMVGGSQFFGFHRSTDAVNMSHPKDFQWLMDVLKAFPHPVFFLDGDVHYSRFEYIPKDYIGYPTYQLTSSGIHSVSVGNSRKRGVETELGYFGYMNYNLVRVTNTSPQSVDFSMKCCSRDGIEYQFDVNVKHG